MQIVIRFPMTKGEGEFPSVSDFNEQERADFRKTMTFNVCWNSHEVGVEDVRITDIEILYDGITHIEDEDYGYRFEDASEYLEGYPAPIVRFTLDKDVDPEEFCRSVHTSNYYIETDSMDEGYIAEDWNGYISVVEEVEDVLEYLKDVGALCNKRFSFPDGMPEEGHPIPATEFALAPKTS